MNKQEKKDLMETWSAELLDNGNTPLCLISRKPDGTLTVDTVITDEILKGVCMAIIGNEPSSEEVMPIKSRD